MASHHSPLASSVIAATIIGSCAALVGVGVAAEPGKEGRVLPALVKTNLWKFACDIPSVDWNVDCSANTDPAKCTWKRSGGEAFEPLDDMNMHRAASSGFIWSMLSPSNDELKLGSYADGSDESMSSFLFRLVSGLDVSLPGVEGQPFRLNPAAVAWAERELMPAPSEPMCGPNHTAQELYDRAFKRSTRTFALALAHLAKTGNLKKVDLVRLDKERGQRRGGYWNTCRAFATANKKTYDEGMLLDNCFFWLRRGASSALPDLAIFTAHTLEKYDPTFHATHAKSFAKAAGSASPAPARVP